MTSDTGRWASQPPIDSRDFDYGVGEDLLSGTFSNALLTGVNGSTSGGFSVATVDGASLTYNSNNFLDFSNVVESDLSIALTSINPSLPASRSNTVRPKRCPSTA